MKNTKDYISSFFNQLLRSPLCLLCHRPSQQAHPLCHGCEQDLPWLDNYCPQCAEPLSTRLTTASAALSNTNASAIFCGHCVKQPPAFNHTYAPLRYDFPADLLIQRIKHRADYQRIELLSQLFVKKLPQLTMQSKPHQLIPVPLHPNRLRQRGYNQAIELAYSIAARLRIPVNTRACSRLLDTPHQQGLNAKQRRRNLRHAFSVDPEQLKMIGPYQQIALIDDVMTTGTTAQVLAEQLKEAGVEHVSVWCLARTPAGRLHHSTTDDKNSVKP